MIPERSKTNEVMPLMAPVYCLKRVSRPQQREGEPKQSQAVSTELRRQLEFGEVKMGQSTKEEKMHGEERAV